MRRRVLRRERRAHPTVRGTTGVFERFRSERREIDRDLRIRRLRESDRLALPAGARQLVVLTVVLDLLARERATNDLYRFFHSRERPVERHAVQALDDL